jgi:hypothetical protein
LRRRPRPKLGCGAMERRKICTWASFWKTAQVRFDLSVKERFHERKLNPSNHFLYRYPETKEPV